MTLLLDSMMHLNRRAVVSISTAILVVAVSSSPSMFFVTATEPKLLRVVAKNEEKYDEDVNTGAAHLSNMMLDVGDYYYNFDADGAGDAVDDYDYEYAVLDKDWDGEEDDDFDIDDYDLHFDEDEDDDFDIDDAFFGIDDDDEKKSNDIDDYEYNELDDDIDDVEVEEEEEEEDDDEVEE